MNEEERMDSVERKCSLEGTSSPRSSTEGTPCLSDRLAICLSTRYKELRVIEDLEQAIFLGREALIFTQKDMLIGRCHWITEELFSLYARPVHSPPNVSSSDLSAARAWIHVAEDFQHPTISLLAYETFLQLLIQHLTILPSLPRHLVILKCLTSSLAVDAFSACLRNRSPAEGETSLRLLIQHLTILPSLPRHLVILKNLTSSLAVDAFSTCLRHRSPAKAVELLEQGRSVFWSQLTLHSPLYDVIASGMAGKSLADEFVRLTSLFRHAVDSPEIHLALHEGHLTIQQIIGCDLENPEFAYLSACHTTVGDEDSPDEVIHLASAMQFVGFRSVIGMMWAVDEAEMNKITSTFTSIWWTRLARAVYALNKRDAS
ncbi:hypothetical protein L210DRAFT_3647893 [Boletus edulis BED1]|uniref:CHAT domain-containing protein n=1 Tax=Boletus edulis BED1 TaxID=1328754 RepID=A0AAD4GCA6_BOLED|nr:hypothetical protein L210DRAFT_3647893 [Boletus edulis BED1]